MIYVGIDVAKAKHDCCILSSDGSALREPFTFANDQGGFDLLMAPVSYQIQELKTLTRQSAFGCPANQAQGQYLQAGGHTFP